PVQPIEQRGPGNPSWPKGVSGNPAGRESKVARTARIEKICKEWCAPFGGRGVLRPAELALLKTAAELSLHCPRRHEDVIRYANTISRIMAQCGLANKHEREPIEEEPPQPPDRSATDWIDEMILKAKSQEGQPSS